MQFSFNCERALSADGEGVAVIDARKYVGAVPSRSGVHLNHEVAQIIDEMGKASSLVSSVSCVVIGAEVHNHNELQVHRLR